MHRNHLFQATAGAWNHLHVNEDLEENQTHTDASLLLMPSWVEEEGKENQGIERRGREILHMQICYVEVGELKVSGSEQPEVSAQVWSGMQMDEQRGGGREAENDTKRVSDAAAATTSIITGRIMAAGTFPNPSLNLDF